MRRRAVAVLVALLAAAALAAGPAAATPGPPDAPEYWFDSWQVQSLWDSGADGHGVTIAEIDTGVNAALPALRGRVLSGTDLGIKGNGQIDREVDAFGHGTAMASIMVARPGLLDITGLAPGARILPIAVPLSGTTDSERPDRLSDAIRYAVDHHAKVISMSLGGRRSPHTDPQPCSTDEQEAVFYALSKGSLVIASVGNTGPTKNIVEDPAVCLGVISVGAVDASGTVADFSSREPFLTLVAPGVSIPSLSRVSGEAYSGDGTSQATAITSAAAALVWSKYPSLDPRGVATRLIATLDDRRRTPSSAYGYGRLDAYRAVTADVAVDSPNPVFDAAAPFMARADALAAAAPAAPRPAAKPVASTGSYVVGSAPRLTREVRVGIGLAVGGLLALLLLLVIGWRGRRRRKAVASLPLAQPEFAPESDWPRRDDAEGETAPRPRPRPGPGAAAPEALPPPGP